MPSATGRAAPLLLVATDDSTRRRGLCAALSRAGYVVKEAGEGAAGVAAFRAVEPDAVVLDAVRTEEALWTCHNMRRAERSTGATPILMLVGPEQLDALDAARAAGVTDFVERTVYAALLEHRVRQALENCTRIVGALQRAEQEDEHEALDLADRLLAVLNGGPRDAPAPAPAPAPEDEADDEDDGSPSLEQDLAGVLERDELLVCYQPKVDVRSRLVVGMEALVRWQHPRFGLVRPDEFIPLAEQSGMIVPIGEWVLRTACRQNKLWQDLGLQPVRMAVNLSQVQFQRPELCQVVTDVLTETGLDAEWLELELTESMLMQDVQATSEGLRRLKASGLHLSIDDFGTGYSSLSYLRRFPIDTLKIDRSFVRDVLTDPDDAAIVTSIIIMGHSLRMTVIAEGVETESQMSFLEALQCDEVQGYLISPAVPAGEAQRYLDGGRR